MKMKSMTGSSVVALAASLVAGCAAQERSAAVKLETRDSSSLVIGNPIVKRSDEGYSVRGTVHRPTFSPMSSSGHVHVEVVDATGKVVQTAFPTYSPPPGRHSPRVPGPRTATYEAILTAPMPDGATVRVSAVSDAHSPEN